MKKIQNVFPKIRGEIRFSEPLGRHTTFQIGGPCTAWVEPKDENDLQKIVNFARKNKRKIFILGMGSNVLFRDRGFNGIVVNLGDKHFKKISFKGTSVRAGAGAKLGRLIELTCKKGLSGLERLVGIPASLGGAIFMNAGHKEDISDSLKEIKALDLRSGKLETLKRKSIKLGYRKSNLRKFIITEVTLKLTKAKKRDLLKKKDFLLKEKRKKQPMDKRSAGCIFRNPGNNITAAQYIEMSGLKGKRIGGAAISKKHANFFINIKNAKAKDVLQLMALTKRRVHSRFNVRLKPEIIIVKG